MKITIRKGKKKDLPIVLSFIKQLHELEHSKIPLTNTATVMKKEQKFFNFIVAEINSKVVGIAIFYFSYLAYTGKSLYLEVLFVKKAYRDKGVGNTLFKKIFEVAEKEHCTRIRWQVDKINHRAIKYYRKKGAKIGYSSLNCDLFQRDIKKFL